VIPVVVCKDTECRAHGKYLRRIRRLQLALVRERGRRRRLAVAWTAYLDLALAARLDDGTPILQIVLETNPELRRRLEAALNPGGKDD